VCQGHCDRRLTEYTDMCEPSGDNRSVNSRTWVKGHSSEVETQRLLSIWLARDVGAARRDTNCSAEMMWHTRLSELERKRSLLGFCRTIDHPGRRLSRPLLNTEARFRLVECALSVSS
jgi:hypothetical protein